MQQSRWHEQKHEAYTCSTAQIKLEPNLALEVRANPVPHLPNLFTIAFSHVLLLDSRKCTVKRKLLSAVLPIYYLASIENASVQIAPVPVQPLGSDACMKACMAGMPAVLAQLIVAPGPTQPTQQQQPGLLPDGGRLLGR